jgi:hypothetical protein
LTKRGKHNTFLLDRQAVGPDNGISGLPGRSRRLSQAISPSKYA